MNKEIKSIIQDLQQVMNGQPWFGRPVMAILQEVDPTKAFTRPNNREHSLIELLYHMITWAEFTLKSVEDAEETEIKAIQKLDWREIDPAIHSWEKGLKELQSIHDRLVKALESKDDNFLDETVKLRKFNFRFMLQGMIQHDIYHLGQVAYVKKMLD